MCHKPVVHKRQREKFVQRRMEGSRSFCAPFIDLTCFACSLSTLPLHVPDTRYTVYFFVTVTDGPRAGAALRASESVSSASGTLKNILRLLFVIRRLYPPISKTNRMYQVTSAGNTATYIYMFKYLVVNLEMPFASVSVVVVAAIDGNNPYRNVLMLQSCRRPFR